MTAAAMARATGFRPQLIDNYLKGSMPGADKAIRLARALDVPVEWLVTGELADGSAPSNRDDWLTLPRLDLDAVGHGPAAATETVAVRRDWLGLGPLACADLWLTAMPAHVLDGGPAPGDPILCQTAATRGAEGTYLYLWNGAPLARCFEGPRVNELADGSRAWVWEPDDPPGMRLVARILGSLKMRPL